MKQILHLLKKDLRANRFLILLSLLPVIAEIWIAPYQWAIPVASNGWGTNEILRGVGILLLMVIVICWAILIARVVHAESLIGDRQFWLTRPYNRFSLLGAKLLFAVLTISLPFLVLHGILLAEAGFSPWHWLPQLLLNSAAIYVGLLLSLFVIAAITSTFTQTILIFIGLLLLIVLLIPFSLLTGWGADTMPSHLVTIANQVSDVVFCGAAIFVQYRYRKTILAVSLLVASIVIPSVILPWANLQSVEVDRNYQPITSSDAANYEFSASQLPNYSTPPPSSPFDLRAVETSLHFRNRGPEYGMHLDGMRYTLESADGQRWQSNWKMAWSDPMIYGNTNDLNLRLPALVYNRFAAHPVRIRIQLAISELKAGDSRRYTLLKPLQEFAVADVGYCASQPGFGNYTLALPCRLPFNRAPLMLVRSALFSSQRCSDSDRVPNHDAVGWIGPLSPSESSFQLLPVQSPSFPIIANSIVTDPALDKRMETNLCPGASVTFTPYNLVRRMQTTVTIDSYDLKHQPEGLQMQIRTK
jgi:hypothetical protein